MPNQAGTAIRNESMTVAGGPKSADEIRSQIAQLEKDLRAAEQAEERAAQAGNAKRAISLLSAMKTAKSELERLFPGTFDNAAWQAITPQAWPRTNRFKNLAGLSETEVSNAGEAGRKAVQGLK